MVLANAYLLGREYFEMIAMRHMTPEEARRLRKENAPRVLAAGFIPALVALVPLVNVVVPIFSTIYFVHPVQADSRRNPARLILDGLGRIAADVVDEAARALRHARLADIAAMQDQPVVGVRLVRPGTTA